MKLNVLALVTILGCTTNAVLASTCTESSGVCVCSGDCPSFTNDWPDKSTQGVGADASCVAMKNGGSSSVGMDGVITVNDKVYTSIDPCASAVVGGNSATNSAGMFGAYYASGLVTAAAVAGVAAAL
mmetsp:Transcript_10134/g.16750  ORF Transcript_10134/g.16750 Transcript_10134/m.16750 type:complete len:127 (-) Transcript_10134:257-637(-)|eukprot:CAMPEP_0197718304 /NCGR_PEP_ID=MMETSP1434-20131217/2511_1 /TAXON_ID=265543 /ORGANISM="Minutocellus polymorphus, Strain CCMP3303" /LENGTH=126 /DNA_ID=CAMNT_0043302939 /DNA_START=64 /DNA_END=444 /DNA_ORIENTATION=+